ncbi:hypothetical protein Goe17_02490 [Bacillus phage vB_BsuM-Goe17]|nr:hypothetical protein Goe17_00010 [Bacillus phage vB_BsuM-Goe17]WCS69108.1 hypothetical protein Goe17_02490 [Bacillus phage vB_BsuM-Goe17]
MTSEQALRVAGAEEFTYAKVAGLYVSMIESGNYGGSGGIELALDYKAALNLDYSDVEWLHENVENIQFYRIDVQAQSLPVKAEELLR